MYRGIGYVSTHMYMCLCLSVCVCVCVCVCFPRWTRRELVTGWKVEGGRVWSGIADDFLLGTQCR